MTRDEKQVIIITDLVLSIMAKIELLGNLAALIKELSLINADKEEKKMIDAIIAFAEAQE